MTTHNAYKLLKLISVRDVREHIPEAESPMFVSPYVLQRIDCNLCNHHFTPIVYACGRKTYAQHTFTAGCPGIYHYHGSVSRYMISQAAGDVQGLIAVGITNCYMGAKFTANDNYEYSPLVCSKSSYFQTTGIIMACHRCKNIVTEDGLVVFTNNSIYRNMILCANCRNFALAFDTYQVLEVYGVSVVDGVPMFYEAGGSIHELEDAEFQKRSMSSV